MLGAFLTLHLSVDGSVRHWAPLMAMVFIGLVAKATTTWTLWSLVHTDRPVRHLMRRYMVARRMHWWLWVAVTGVIFFGCGWLQLAVERSESAIETILRRLLFIAPLVVPWLLSWAAFFEIECHVTGTTATRFGRLRARSQYVLQQARLYFGMIVLPLVLVLLWTDISRSVFRPETVSVHVWLLHAVGIVLVIVLLPTLLVRIWPTQTLGDNNIHERLLRFGQRQGMVGEKIRLWQTQGSMCNAVVLGALRPWRYVLISDGLMMRLSPLELEAVYAHELAHVHQRHALLRLLWILVPVGWWTAGPLVWQQFSGMAHVIRGAESVLERSSLGTGIWQAASWGPAVLTLAYLVIGLGRLGRWLEHLADAWAVDRLQQQWGASRSRAVYQSMLHKVAGDRATRGGWLHPSVDARCRRLQAAQENFDPHGSEQNGSRQAIRPSVVVLRRWFWALGTLAFLPYLLVLLLAWQS